MVSGLISVLMTAIAAVVSFVAAPRGDNYGAMRIAIVWILIAAVAFLIPNKWLMIAMIAAILAICAPFKSVDRVYLYIGVFAAIPASLGLNLPFPGLNYLIEINYAKVATIVLLGPVFIQKTFLSQTKFNTVDGLLLAFVILTGVISIRDVSFTSMIRVTIDQMLLVFVPYIAISRSLTTQKEVENAVKALFVGIVILAAIGVFSTLKQWNYYVHVADVATSKMFNDYRNGFLRVGATLVPALLGLVAGVGMAASLVFRSKKEHPGIYIFIFWGVFAFVLFVTGARGAWLATGLVLVAYGLLLKLSKPGRQFVYFLGAAIVCSVLVLVFQDSALLTDKYGTFDYRADLLRTSMEQIADRPLFGSADFLETARFAHLVQGEGIIDLVNVYLQLALHYGLVGLALYLGAHFLTLRGNLKLFGTLPRNKNAEENIKSLRRVIALLIASHVGFLLLIATISAVSYIWHFGYLILGMSAAQLKIGASALAPAEAKKTIAPTVATADAQQTPPSASSLPYGARFVRRR